MTDSEHIADVMAHACEANDPEYGWVKTMLIDLARRVRESCAEEARAQKKRYTCNRMRGVCDAIADSIKHGGKE